METDSIVSSALGNVGKSELEAVRGRDNSQPSVKKVETKVEKEIIKILTSRNWN